MAAETLKKGKGFVSLGGVYADPDDVDAARISKLIRSTMTRLHVDINRSIAYYRTTLSGAAPKRVYLTGGSSQLPYLDLFIADKLSLPVAYFNPLRNVTLGKSLNTTQLQQNHCYTAELVGMALRETGSCPAEVSLEAPSLMARADKRRKQPYYFCALAAWAILFVCLSLYYYQQTVLANQMATQLKEKSDALPALSSVITKLAKEENGLQHTFDLAARLGDQRDDWLKILAALNDKIPEGVWITQLTPELGGGGVGETPAPAGNRKGPGGAPPAAPAENTPAADAVTGLTITGLYHSNSRTQIVSTDKLRDFVLALADLPYFDIDKSNLSSTLTGMTTGGGDPAFAKTFSIQLKLKTPISFKP